MKETKQTLVMTQQWVKVSNGVQVYVDEKEKYHSVDGLVTA